jgi:hypothetical protein
MGLRGTKKKEEAMRPFLWYLWLAGAVQLLILLANIPLPKILQTRENLARVSPMIREMFIVHWGYIVLVLGIFATLCFGFASDLAGASRLGRFLSACMAIFWLVRVPIQIFFYDSETRRRNRLADAGFLACFSYLGVVFTAAALGVLR